MSFSKRFRQGIFAEGLHAKISQHPFLQKYHRQPITVTPLDHYRHLCQLLPIYEVLEGLMQRHNFSCKLPEKLKDLLMQSEKIKQDIVYLETNHIPYQYRSRAPLNATVQYIKFIKEKAATKGHGDASVLGHYLSRIVGDFFGGQRIKAAMERVLGTTEHGTKFYSFNEERNVEQIYAWLDERFPELDYTSTQKIIVQHGRGSLLLHETIFNELEKPPRNFCARFFSYATLTVATAAVVAATAYSFSNR